MNKTAAKIQKIMLKEGKTLSTAESCTSGRIAAQLTTVSGASGYFQGGVIAYQDAIKIQQLGVSAEDIERYDVVSQAVAEQMVRGACRLFGTDYAMASTGYAGIGTEKIPSGTIWIAWGTEKDVQSRQLHLTGTREQNTREAVQTALVEFLRYIY